MTGSAKGLEVLVRERGTPARQLYDVVDVEVPDPATDPAVLAREPIPVDHVRSGRVPEIPSAEAPLAGATAVGGPSRGQRTLAFHASAESSCFHLSEAAFREPESRISEDPRGGSALGGHPTTSTPRAGPEFGPRLLNVSFEVQGPGIASERRLDGPRPAPLEMISNAVSPVGRPDRYAPPSPGECDLGPSAL